MKKSILYNIEIFLMFFLHNSYNILKVIRLKTLTTCIKRVQYLLFLSSIIFVLIGCSNDSPDDKDHDNPIDTDDPSSDWSLLDLEYRKFLETGNQNRFQWIDFDKNGYVDLIYVSEGKLYIHFNTGSKNIIDSRELLLDPTNMNMQNIGFGSGEYRPGDISSFGLADRDQDGDLDLIVEMEFRHNTMGHVGDINRIVAFTNNNKTFVSQHVEADLRDFKSGDTDYRHFIWESIEISNTGMPNFIVARRSQSNKSSQCNYTSSILLSKQSPYSLTQQNNVAFSFYSLLSDCLAPSTLAMRTDFYHIYEKSIQFRYYNGDFSTVVVDRQVQGGHFVDQHSTTKAMQAAVIKSGDGARICFTPYQKNVISDQSLPTSKLIYVSHKFSNLSDQSPLSGSTAFPTTGRPIGIVAADIYGDGTERIILSEIDDNDQLVINSYQMSPGDGSISFEELLYKVGSLDHYSYAWLNVIDFDKDGKQEIYLPYMGKVLKLN